VARVQNHRRWAAIAHSLPSSIELWLATTDTTSRCETLIGIEGKLAALKKAVKETQECLASFGRTSGDGPFALLSLSGTPRDIEERCCTFVAKLPLLPYYAALLREQEAAKKLGLTNLLKHSEHSQVSTEILIQTFRGAVAWQQAKAVWEADDELRYFQSNEHERLRRKFQDDDDKQLKTNRRFIKTRIGNGDVTQGWRGRTPGEHTDYVLLQHEMGKQRRHLPIRKLVRRAGSAMQDLCPCWMMTPLAVAQFLAPGTIHFDVIIMDEASQINPEDAWGAIARGKQLVVVGDQKQMPPSDFFMSALEEDESPEDEDEIDGGKSESILDASVTSLLSSLLLWHYRSRQETLIAPANSFSYDNRLILFPHSHRNHPELGIRYTYIANATTTTGKVINALEAEAVARRVRELVLREYAKAPKDRLTVGVVTMNLYQQDAVLDLLEKMRQDDRRFDLAMTALTSEQNEEPLFVRNLENIQGDERDIMLLSCTYGPHSPGGTPAQRFGPLNREGGERRFNVLITRAKWRMEVFSSIRSDQILVDGKRQGVCHFHLFLKYAESGVLVDRGEATGKQSDSPFEIQVEAVLRRAGFETERQVGVAGYFIDLGVKHPHHPGLFALGVECDGKTYHSSRAARDRDRLREKVLLDRGWKLHRIWSTDWFVNPQQAKQKLIDAVKSACR
jgi:very-short-patch-repair endonuclease